MRIRLFRATELPSEVAGSAFTDGDTTVILVNPNAYDGPDPTGWARGVANSLLDEVTDGQRPAIRRVG